MRISKEFLGRLVVLIAIVPMGIVSEAQSPTLGDSRAKTEEWLRLVCRYFNADFKKVYGHDSAATVNEIGDTLIYRVSSNDEVQYEYIFLNDTCVAIRVRFACLACLHLTYRKWYFKGRWRVDENETLYRFKDPARATIKRAVDCPFLYEVNLIRMDSPVPKSVFRSMKKVKKKRIGRWDYLLPQTTR
ncbi:MAG: hypothetical protein IPL52_05145 [Flavobacteriales bacterium]|nr:hypothetical protein [Flavobacteriales bacterium]